MIGFYLNVEIKPIANIKIHTITFEDFSDLRDLKNNCLYLFIDDYSDPIAQSEEINIYTVGAVIYRNEWGKRATNLILQDLITGYDIRYIVKELSGQFCLIISEKENVYIITDKLSSFPVYRTNNSKCTHISNILPCLLRHNNVSINPQSTSEYICFGYSLDSTFYNEINWLDEATIYKYGKENSEIKYENPYANIKFCRYRNPKEVANILTDILKNKMLFLDKNDRIFVDMTGGFDTRTIAAILRNENYQFTGGICADPFIHIRDKFSDELKIARMVAEVLKVDFCDNFIIENYDSYLENLNIQNAITAGIPIPFSNVDYLNYFLRIKNDYSIHICGYVGTQGFDQEMKNLNLLSTKFDINPFFGKRYQYLNVFSDNFITQKDFQEAISIKFKSWLQEFGTDNFKHVAAYLSILGYSKGWHGTLLNTQTCILPVYAPFYDIDCIRVLLETDYNIKKRHIIQRHMINNINPDLSSIMTTHGYNANPYSTNFKQNVIIKCKDFIRPVIYQSNALIHLRHRLDKFINPAVDINEYGETFCEKYMNECYTNDMEIFSFVDRGKLEKQTDNMPKKYKQTLFARLLFINGMIDKYNVSYKK